MGFSGMGLSGIGPFWYPSWAFLVLGLSDPDSP